MAPEGGLDLLPLVQAEQTVVDEDAGEPVAHGAVHQHGRDRGVHPARQSADDPRGRADQLPDPRDLALDEVARRPVRRAAADLEQEVVDDLPAPRRVRHLRMELDAEERLLAVLEGGDRASCRSRR